MAKTFFVLARPSWNHWTSVLRVTPFGKEGCFTARLYLRPRRLTDRYFDDAESRLVGGGCDEKRHRHVVDGRIPFRAPFERAAMRVAVENGRHAVAVERLFQARRAEERRDLRRLAHHRGVDRRVVQHRDLLRRAQPGQGRLELQRLVDRLPHELFDDVLAPCSQRAASEAAAEALYPGEADAVHLG